MKVWVHPRVDARLLTFLKGRVFSPAAFGIGAWNALPEPRDALDFPYLPAPLASGGSLAAAQEAYVPTDPPGYFGALSGASMQTFQAQTPHASDLGVPYELVNELVQARELQGHVHNTIRGLLGLNEDIGGFIDVPGPILDINPRGANANPPFFRGNATEKGGWMNTSDIPTPNGPSTSTLSFQLRGARSPPQTHEGDVEKLYNRLIREGADIGAAMALRFIIFADGVTIDALMAPIETPEMVRVFGGATRMWKLLLETKVTVTGKKKYRCLLCPIENRREYGHNRDAVRHFNKAHFGFSFPCDYWWVGFPRFRRAKSELPFLVVSV